MAWFVSPGKLMEGPGVVGAVLNTVSLLCSEATTWTPVERKDEGVLGVVGEREIGF